MARTESFWDTGVGGTYLKTISPIGYDILINGSNKYLNFNATVGSTGYGFRDNNGTMEFKNSGGAWTGIGSPDLSAYLTKDQSTPQTTVGNFSFPSVSVTAGNMNQYSPMLFGTFSNTPGYIPIWNGAGGFDSNSGLYYSTALREFQTPSIYASDGVTSVYLNDGVNAINATGKSYLNGAVTLGAGSATAGTAPLKFTSGPITTAAVAGQLEYFTNRFYIRGTDKLTIGGDSGTYQLQIVDSDTATGGILVSASTYTNIPNPGSVSNSALFNARGFGFSTDGYTLGATFQPTLGIGLAGNRGPMLGIKASATGAAIAIEQGRIGVGTAGPETPIDSIGNIQTRSTSGTAYETRTRMVSTYYGAANNYASGGLEIDGVQAAVGYGLFGATRFYAGANTDATRGWAWKADGLLGVTTLAASGAQMVLNKAGYLGIGTIAPAVRLHVISATEQLRVGYDTSIYWNATTAATTGVTTFDAVGGTTPSFVFSDKVTFSTEVELDGDLNHDGTNIGFFGVAPTTRQTELTDELTTITCTAPGTPDYAIQDLVNIAGYGFVTKDEGNSVLKVIANLQTRVNELETKLTAYGLLQDAD